MTAPGPQARGFLFSLRKHGGRVELCAPHMARYGAIYADWCDAESRRRVAAGRRQPLARAIGLHRQRELSVCDATAGLGRDGFVLAALGAQVTMLERNALVFELLEDALHRALADPVARTAAGRIELLHADAREFLGSGRHWDVIYLDPMYPEEKRRALPAKEMQLLRGLTGGDQDADTLLAPALAGAQRRTVVKRPLRAPPLAGQNPDLELRATQLRFDVYLKATPPEAG